MYKQYIVTGATGYLGSNVTKRLAETEANIRVLVMPGDRLTAKLPNNTEIITGSVNDKKSLEKLFNGCGKDCCVIHCAGIVSIATNPGKILRKVNICGTKAVTDMCVSHGISKLVYVSSVHAIPEKPKGETISEVSDFSSVNVSGEYAKTKAEATGYVLAAAKAGLNASVVHPSGIIGPNDDKRGNITSMIISYCKRKLPVAVKGGYDFVDVRDVADGILACCEKGKAGECYILSNRFVTIKEILDTLKKLTNGKSIYLYLPLKIAGIFAPIVEKCNIKKSSPMYFTPYSIETLGTNAVFSHEKATKELGYYPRSITKTLSDTVAWLKKEKSIAY